MARDPEIVKLIGIKDFDHFINHRQVTDPKADPLLGNALSVLTDGKWKEMRGALSPVFTGSKMRQMFEFVSKCGADMATTLGKKGRQTYDMKQLFTRFTSDVIATSAFGIEVNSFEDMDNDFFKLGQKIINFNSPKVGAKIFGFILVPWLMRLLKVRIFDEEATAYFRTIIGNNFATREANNIVRNDLIQLLMQMKKGKTLQTEEPEATAAAEGFATVQESEIGKKSVTRTWTDDELLAQCFIFFIAGFETASVLLHFVAYELALNADIQQKLFEEVQATSKDLQGHNLTYEALQKMQYMDQVVSEGLRKWPPAVVTDRLCTKDYTLNMDGQRIDIKKGDVIWFPIYAFHHDHKHFPNPEKFDPERFNNENKHTINNAIYMPFGVGPRNCIGSRFALMESKAVLYYLLLNFSLEVDNKTRVPLKIKKGFAGFASESGIHLKFGPRV
jgi:cytochrome P450 family 9